MTESGTVVRLDGPFAVVRIDKKAVCESCKMCAFPKGEKHLDVRVENTLNAKEGDLVELSLHEKSALTASMLVYLVPLALAALGMLIGKIFQNDLISLILCLIFLSLGYILVNRIDKRIRKNNHFAPVMTAVFALDQPKGAPEDNHEGTDAHQE